MSGVRSSWETLEVKSARSRASSPSRRSWRRATAASAAVTASSARRSGSRDAGRVTASWPAAADGSTAWNTGPPGAAVTVSPAYPSASALPRRSSGAPSGVRTSTAASAALRRPPDTERGSSGCPSNAAAMNGRSAPAHVTTPYAASGASCTA